jgi:signal peptidase
MNAETQSRSALERELAAETLRRFSEVRFVARGSSMVPTVYPGDCLTVKSFGSQAPRARDIVLYRRAGEFRVHRIVNILRTNEARFYVLRGDALTDDDPPVPASELLGRVASVLRRGKPFEPGAQTGAHYRALRLMVRRCELAALLLLRWHTMSEQRFLKAELLRASSAQAKAACT